MQSKLIATRDRKWAVACVIVFIVCIIIIGVIESQYQIDNPSCQAVADLYSHINTPLIIIG